MIAVAEFYEVAEQLKSDLIRAKIHSWTTVALVVLVIGATLFAIVERGAAPSTASLRRCSSFPCAT